MDFTNIIIRPLVSEKSTHQHETRNIHAFQVHPDANKPTIKQAVEKLYNVKVKHVRTLNRKGKTRRGRKGTTVGSDWKRAIVVLAPDNKIELY